MGGKSPTASCGILEFVVSFDPMQVLSHHIGEDREAQEKSISTKMKMHDACWRIFGISLLASLPTLAVISSCEHLRIRYRRQMEAKPNLEANHCTHDKANMTGSIDKKVLD